MLSNYTWSCYCLSEAATVTVYYNVIYYNRQRMSFIQSTFFFFLYASSIISLQKINIFSTCYKKIEGFIHVAQNDLQSCNFFPIIKAFLSVCLGKLIELPVTHLISNCRQMLIMVFCISVPMRWSGWRDTPTGPSAWALLTSPRALSRIWAVSIPSPPWSRSDTHTDSVSYNWGILSYFGMQRASNHQPSDLLYLLSHRHPMKTIFHVAAVTQNSTLAL